MQEISDQRVLDWMQSKMPVFINVNKANMDERDSKTATAAEGGIERRVQHNLRLIFDDSCRMTAAFFDPAQNWGDSSLTLYARQTLRDAYPELTQQEIAILFSGVVQFHKQRSGGHK